MLLITLFVSYQVEDKTCDYVRKVFAELNSPNKCNVKMEHGGNWWVTDFNDPQYVAGSKATQNGNYFILFRLITCLSY